MHTFQTSMMMAKLGEKRKKHADYGCKRVPHLRLTLLPLGAAAFRVAIRPRVMIMTLQPMIFLHCVHSNVPVDLLSEKRVRSREGMSRDLQESPSRE